MSAGCASGASRSEHDPSSSPQALGVAGLAVFWAGPATGASAALPRAQLRASPLHGPVCTAAPPHAVLRTMIHAIADHLIGPLGPLGPSRPCVSMDPEVGISAGPGRRQSRPGRTAMRGAELRSSIPVVDATTRHRRRVSREMPDDARPARDPSRYVLGDRDRYPLV